MDKRLLFCGLCLTMIGYIVVTKYLLIDESLYFNSFAEQLSYERIEQLIENEKKWAWLGYVLIPVWFLIKITLVASCLWLVVFFAELKLSFGKLAGIVVVAETVSLVPPLIKLGWFLFVQTDYTLTDLQWFSPLSALSLFDRDHVQTYLAYPLQLLSVWELTYWIVLAHGLGKLMGKSTAEGFRWVALSYGPALTLWVVFVVFLSVNLAP